VILSDPQPVRSYTEALEFLKTLTPHDVIACHKRIEVEALNESFADGGSPSLREMAAVQALVHAAYTEVFGDLDLCR
jgi:hypothetical protein